MRTSINIKGKTYYFDLQLHGPRSSWYNETSYEWYYNEISPEQANSAMLSTEYPYCTGESTLDEAIRSIYHRKYRDIQDEEFKKEQAAMAARAEKRKTKPKRPKK